MRMKLTREELYERVWQKPIREVAAELGISDVGLAKACRKNNIPLPHQGHWLKKPGRARDRLKVLLPAAAPGARLEFHFQGSEFAVLQVRDQAREDAEKRLAETPRPATEDKRLVQFAKDARKAIDLRKVDERGIVRCDGPSPWPCRTSPENVERGLSVLKSLWARLQSMGIDVEQSEKNPVMVRFEIDGGRYWYWIEEHSNQSFRDLTAKELAEKQRAEKTKTYWWAPNLKVYTPTGKILVKLSHESSEYIRRKWSDTNYAQVEERIDEIIAGTFSLAAEDKREREQRAREKELEAARQLRVRQAMQLKEFKKLKRKRLFEEASAWNNAQSLRDYIEAVRETPLDKLPMFQAEADKAAWIDWASRKADGMDPLTSGTAGTTPGIPALPDYHYSWGYRGNESDADVDYI
jgi:hypothetical protein